MVNSISFLDVVGIVPIFDFGLILLADGIMQLLSVTAGTALCYPVRKLYDSQGVPGIQRYSATSAARFSHPEVSERRSLALTELFKQALKPR